ncbi:MAG: hypothetical protein ACR2G4_01635, partial [Pyrinomonadaceae bacterium]
MKNLRQFCATLALTLVLVPSAFADGYISTVKTDPPPPAPTVAADGFISTVKAAQPTDVVTEITLSLLQS